MPIEVRKPGLATTVQDRGREGYYHVGVPPSGALDQFSLRGRQPARRQPGGRRRRSSAPISGPSCTSREPAVVATTGAEIEPRVNGEAQPAWTSFAVGGRRRAHVRPPEARVRACTSRSLAASTCPRCSAAARPTRSARWAGSRAAPLAGRRRAHHRDGRRTGRPGARCPRSCGRRCRPSSRSAWSWGSTTTCSPTRGAPRSSSTTWTLTPVADRVGFRYKGGAARDGRARAAVRRGQRPVEYRRRAVPDRVDPGPRRGRADHPAPRCGVGRRVRDDRHGHQRRHGHRRRSRRPAPRRASSRSTSRPRWGRAASGPSACRGCGRRSARRADRAGHRVHAGWRGALIARPASADRAGRSSRGR